MSHRDAPAICRKIDAALDFVGDNEDEMRPYLLYQIAQMMGGPKHIMLDDCKTSELMSLAALLAPVFSRRLGGSAGTVVAGVPEEDLGKRVLTLIHNASTGTDR